MVSFSLAFAGGQPLNSGVRRIARHKYEPMKRNLILAWMPLLLCAVSSSAQAISHRCEVSVIDFSTDTGKDLGSFNTIVANEKELTKSFSLPGIKLIATASVMYGKEDSYAEGSEPDEMILALAVGRKAQRDALSVLNNAVARVPLKTFESAKVQMNVRGKSQIMILVMECTKSNKPR